MIAPAISELVPHEPPMLWIDELVSHDAETVTCRVTLRPEHVFVERGTADIIVAIELMAQSVAASVGLEDHVKGSGPRPGYLVAIPEAKFFASTLRVGETIDLVCTRRFGDEQIASFACTARRGDTTLAEAIINVFRPGATP